jgi:large conductance mechanosensitive channel
VTQDAGDAAASGRDGNSAAQRAEAAAEKAEIFFRKSRDRLGISGFRKFILRGNVVDLATGVVIGAAFSALAIALVTDFLTPLINIPLGGATSFSERYWEVSGSKFLWGDLLNKFLSLILIGFALYYFVVIPVNALMERYKPDVDPGKRTKVCPECKSSIPYDATRCLFCTVQQPPITEAEPTG